MKENLKYEELLKIYETLYGLFSRALTDYNIRYENKNLKKCWEIKNCSRQLCPSYNNENLRCWQISGTFCGGKIQGTFAQKYTSCKECEVFQTVCADPIDDAGEQFNNFIYLLNKEKKHVSALNKEIASLMGGVENKHNIYSELELFIDKTTNIYNRHHLFTFLSKEKERTEMYGRPFSILFINIDKFKEINELYGFPEGDKFLKITGELIKRCIRNTDLIFRYGGDEFVTVLTETKAAAAMEVAKRVSSSVGGYVFRPKNLPDENNSVTKTISIGVTSVSHQNDSVQDILDRATKAMQEAKERGGNQIICVSNPND